MDRTVPLRNMTHREVISFVLEHIIQRFGIPQTFTTDQGYSFMSHKFREFAESFGIKLLNSSPYYAQANGQAKSSNKTLIRLIKVKIEENREGGMKSFRKHCGLIEYLNMELLKLHLLS